VATLTTILQDVYPPRVQLTLSGLTVGDDVALYRSVAGQRTLVRASAVTDIGSTALVVIDGELPFGVPVTWVAVVNGSDADTDGPTTYTLPGGKVVLSDAITGLAAEVVILAWPTKDYDRSSSTFPVGGRNVTVLGAWPMFSGDAEFYVDSTAGVRAVLDLLENATEGVIQVRQPGGYDGVDSFVAVLGAQERRMSQDGSDPRRVFVCSLSEVDGWSDELEASGYTYADLEAAYTGLTYADLNGDFATYLALAQGDFSS